MPRLGLKPSRVSTGSEKRGSRPGLLSLDDPEFWGYLPKKMGHVVGGGLSGVASFILGEPRDNPPTVAALRLGPDWVLPRSLGLYHV